MKAKTKLPEFLREVDKGKGFTITRRDRAVADLVPSVSARSKKNAEAVERMREFIRTSRVKIKDIDIKALIEEGRD